MIYEEQNDRIISEDSAIDIKPAKATWKESQSIELAIDDDYVLIAINRATK